MVKSKQSQSSLGLTILSGYSLLVALPVLFCCILVPTISVALSSEGNQPVKIAILQFESLSTDAKEGSKGKIVSEFMTSATVNVGAFDVVEREAVVKILDEMEYGQSGRNVSSVAQKIGQLSGAKYVLTGSVAGYNDSSRIEARLIRVSDGKIEFAQGSFAKNDLESIFNASRFIVEKLTEQFVQNVGQIVVGQTVWVSPEAMVVDKGEKLWLNPDYSVKVDKNAKCCMMVKRTDQGFEVNVMNCTSKWREKDGVNVKNYVPVKKIVY